MTATRAAYSNSQHRSSDTRAAHASGHRSASDTPSSGRERRRQGRARMLKRIAELEARVRVLLDIIAQLSTHAEAPPGLAQPEIFDVFDLTEEQATVACQTDISVDWSKPDVFVALPPSDTTAHADAAAGVAQPVPCNESQLSSTSCVSQCGAEPQQCGSLAQPVAVGAFEFAATTTRLRNLTSVSQDVGTWQALDDTNAKHQVPDVQTQCGPLPQDLKSPNLAPDHAIESETGTILRSPTAPASVNTAWATATISQSLTSPRTQCGPLTPFRASTLAQQAPQEDDCHKDPTDVEVAIVQTQCGHSTQSRATTPAQHAPQVDDSHKDPTDNEVAQTSRTQFGLLPQQQYTLGRLKDFTPIWRTQCGPLTLSRASTLAQQAPQEEDSHKDPADSEVAIVRTQCGPLTQSRASTLAQNAPQEVDSHKDPTDSEVAIARTQCGPLTQPRASTLAQHAPQEDDSAGDDSISQDVAQSVLPLAFVEVATNIIGVYLKRKKPSCNHFKTAVDALVRVSKMHEVTRDKCRQFVESRSLALGEALTESIF